jgi:hypothetical protein
MYITAIRIARVGDRNPQSDANIVNSRDDRAARRKLPAAWRIYPIEERTLPEGQFGPSSEAQ